MTQKLFIYGTLKSGEPNCWLIDNLCKLKHIQEPPRPAITKDTYPLVTDPQTDHVPILVARRGKGNKIKGEVIEVSEKGTSVLDEFEGLDKEGEYKRISIAVENHLGETENCICYAYNGSEKEICRLLKLDFISSYTAENQSYSGSEEDKKFGEEICARILDQ